MYQPRQLREESTKIRSSLEKRNISTELLDEAIKLDKKRRNIIQEVESMRHERNESSEKIGKLKQEGNDKEAEKLIAEMGQLKKKIKELSKKRDKLDEKLESVLLKIPNILSKDVPEGVNESDNRLVEEIGDPKDFDFAPVAHWDLAEQNQIINFEQAQKISGARFAVYHRAGAKLERALINFMLDVQTEENNYEETMTPALVREESMRGTGQLPKFERDMYQTSKDEQFLIPTSEVSLMNLYRDNILQSDDLPIKKTACTPCFRREAGAHGKDTRGLMRQHQFNKVELVWITKPENSEAALEQLLKDAQTILDRLDLPYRIVTLCSGDTGFAANKTYDIEVWIPSQERYREISSCSNCKAFQSRRANIQYRPDPQSDSQYCHTLNGSGLAVGRCWLALLENYQHSDGSVTIPDPLRPYMNGLKKIDPPDSQ